MLNLVGAKHGKEFCNSTLVLIDVINGNTSLHGNIDKLLKAMQG